MQEPLFRQAQFERIFKYCKQCKYLIALESFHTFTYLLHVYMTDNIAYMCALICTAVQNLQSSAN